MGGNNSGIQGLIIFLIVLGFFAVIAIVAFIIYKVLHPKLKNGEEEHQNTEQENAKENLDRILEPVEDEEIAKKIEEYKEDE